MERDSRETRLNWVDAAKGIGILLVVVGHVIRGMATADLISWNSLFRFADAWIYAFHMPLFFFVSGLFLCRSALRLSPLDYFLDKARTIAYPYFVWSVITVLLKSALGSIPNYPRGLSDLSHLAFAPIEQYWFLYVLFILTVLFGVLSRLASPWFMVLIAILVYPGILPISSGWYALQQVREFAIYIAIGAVVGSYCIGRISHSSVWLLAALAVGGLAVPAFGAAFEFPHGVPLLALSGTVGAVALAVLFDRIRLAGLIGFLGRHSLEIFVVHSIASAAIRTLLQSMSVRSPGMHLILGCAAGIMVPIAVGYAFNAVGFRMAFTLPKPNRKEPVVHQT